MKPVFKQEIEFFKEKTGIELPQYCWRDKSKFYLNCDSKTPILTFQVKNNEIFIKKNYINKTNEKNRAWKQECKKYRKQIKKLWRKSFVRMYKYIKENPVDVNVISVSGGKDSDVNYLLSKKVFEQLNKEFVVKYYNPTNDTAQTYLHIKNFYENIDIVSPQKGIFDWIAQDKNYYLPTILARNCCSTYKEGKIKQELDKNKTYLACVGIRKSESTSRSKYEFNHEDYLRKTKIKSNMPKNYKRIMPIIDWEDYHIWLFMLDSNVLFNDMYKLGFNRVGCLVCPQQTAYTDMLIQYFYPKQWARWRGIVKKNYEIKNVENRLKWTFEEYMDQQWKVGQSKEQTIITRKMTYERVKQLAELKGISEDVAKQYWDRFCYNNNNNTKSDKPKKLNPDEVAMNMKLFGRHINQPDRKWYCKKCIIEMMGWDKKEYGEKVREFREGGCNLF